MIPVVDICRLIEATLEQCDELPEKPLKSVLVDKEYRGRKQVGQIKVVDLGKTFSAYHGKGHEWFLC